MYEDFNRILDAYRDQMKKDLEELIRIPSVLDLESAGEGAPFGKGVQDALDWIIGKASAMGFETKNYDGYAVSATWGDQGEAVGILGHIDVVPPGEGWATDPFVPVVEDGKMYGRGTIDDKGPMLAALYAVKAVSESGLPVKNHIRYIAGGDEETGHRCIHHYLEKEAQPARGFSPDGLFPVIHAEKGILRFQAERELTADEEPDVRLKSVRAGTVVNAVPDEATAVLGGEIGRLMQIEAQFKEYEEKRGRKDSCAIQGEELVLIFTGVSAHAMQPWEGENAILPLLDFLSRAMSPDSEKGRLVRALHRLFGDSWDGAAMGIACEDALSGKLSMNLGILNLDEDSCEFKVDVRAPVHIDLDVLWRTIRLTFEKYGMSPEYWQKRPALYVPKEDPLVCKLSDVFEETTGMDGTPIVIGGGTYCRDVQNFVSFGPVFPGEAEMAHQANEYIDLERFYQIAKIYAQAIYELVR